MNCGIYCIEHIESGKKYIGKSKNIKTRWHGHKSMLRAEACRKDCNRYLYHAVKKYGLDSFKFWVVEALEMSDSILSERELYWMDYYESCDRQHGYNLRRDSSSGMEVHADTRKLLSQANSGMNNPNYGNRWSQEMKDYMSLEVKNRYKAGLYSKPETVARKKQASKEAAARLRSDPEKFNEMSRKVKEHKQQFNKFLQYERSGEFIREWDTKEEIVARNAGYKWQNVYAACNGSKPTYMGFIWRMVSKECKDYPIFVELGKASDKVSFQIGKCIQRDRLGAIPELDTAIARLIGKGLSEYQDDLVEEYILRYIPDEYDTWCEQMASEYEAKQWEALYGEDGLGLDPLAGLIKD